MNYKTYAEAKIANPDCEIVTTGKDWAHGENRKGLFESLRFYSDVADHKLSDEAWVICNPADYCSSLKEFFNDGFKLVAGDKIIGTDKDVWDIAEYSEFHEPDEEDEIRFILSASALNGGCKIPAKVEQWTIYNNTLPLCELTDEQYGKMRRTHDAGAAVEFANVTNEFKFEVIDKPNWCKDQVYRIKPKSERKLFIETSAKLMTSETERTMEQMFGAQFDAGARYTDLTQHFGENI